MTKKQTRDPEGRKRVIAAAAAELIMELGMSNVTHRKVAERAGVPLGSTTQHFANLDELLRAAIVHLSDENTQDLEKLAAKLEKATDIPRTLARMLSVYSNGTTVDRGRVLPDPCGSADPHERPG